MADDILRSQIDIDFQKSIASTEVFDKSIQDLSIKFEKLSKIADKMNMNIASIIQKEISKINNVRSTTNVSINRALKQKMEKALSDMIAARDISLKTERGGKLRLNMKLSDTQAKKINKIMLDDLVRSFKPGALGSVNITLNREQGDLIKKKFQSFLQQKLTTSGGFKINMEGGGLPAIDLDRQHFQVMANSIKAQLLEHFTSLGANAVKLTGYGPIQLDGSMFKALADSIRKSIMTIDDKLKVDPNLFKNIPDFNKKFTIIKRHLRRFSNEIDVIVKGLTTTNQTVDTSRVLKSIQQLRQVGEVLENKLVMSFESIINSMNAVPMSTIDSSKVKLFFDKFYTVVNKFIVKNLNQMTESLTKSLPILKTLDAELANAIKITIPKGGIKLNLNNVMKASVAKIQTAIKDNISVDVKVPDSLINSVSRSMFMIMYKYATNYLNSFGAKLFADSQSGFSVNTKSLHAEVRKRLARSMNMSVQDFIKQNPMLSGVDALQKILKENILFIQKKFNQAVFANLRENMKLYDKELKKMEFKPDLEPVRYARTKMEQTQNILVSRIKEMMRVQFNAVIKELRTMSLTPLSVGQQAPRGLNNVIGSQARAGGGRSTGNTPSLMPLSDSNRISPINNIIGGGSYSAGIRSGGDTSTFGSSVVNTMRYMLSGELFHIPYMALRNSMQSFEDFEYTLEKASQNIIAKYRGNEGVAELTNLVDTKQRQGMYGYSEEEFLRKRDDLIKMEMEQITELTRRGVIGPLQDVAKRFAVSQAKMGEIWQIATRFTDNPREAFSIAEAAAGIVAVEREEISPEEAAKGMEAIAAQWQVQARDMEQYRNMIVKASLLSQATAEDILKAQAESGSLMKGFMQTNIASEQVSTQRQFAQSAALQALTIQATSRSGNRVGTFFKSIFGRPFTDPKAIEAMDRYGIRGYEFGQEEDQFGILRGKGEQRSGYNVFTDILQKYVDLKGAGYGADANSLLRDVFKTRYSSMTIALKDIIKSIDVMVGDLEGEGADLKGVDIRKSLDEYVKKIEMTTSAEIDAYIEGLQDPVKVRKERLMLNFETATFGVYDAFKPDMAEFIDTLSGIFRLIEDNAEEFAEMIRLLINLMLGAGIRKYAGKAGDSMRRSMMQAEMQGRVDPLSSRRESLINRSYRAQDLLDRRGQRLLDLNERRNNLTGPGYQSLVDTRTNLSGRLEQIQSRLVAEQSSKAPNQSVIKSYEKDLDRTRQRLGVVDNKLNPIQSNIKRTDSQIERETAKSKRLEETLARTNTKANKLTTDINRLSSAYSQLGASGDRAAVGTDRLGNEVTQVATQMNTTSRNSDKLYRDIGELNVAFDRGAVSAQRYRQELNRLSSASMVTSTNLVTGAGGGAVGASGTLMGRNVPNIGGQPNVRTPVLPTSNLLMMGNRGLSGLKSFAKGVGSMYLYSKAFELISSVGTTSLLEEDEILDRRIRDVEKMNKLADKMATPIEEFVSGNNKGRSTADSIAGILKTNISNAVTLGSGTLQGLWGDLKNAVSGEDINAGITDFLSSLYNRTGDSLNRVEIDQLEDLKKQRDEARKNRIMKEREEREALFTGLPGEEKLVYKDIGTKFIEGVEQTLLRISEHIEMNTKRLGLDSQIGLGELALQGFDNDSEEVMKLNNQFTDSMIDLYTNAINALEFSKNEMIKYQGEQIVESQDFKKLNAEQQKLELLRLQKQIESKNLKSVPFNASLKDINFDLQTTGLESSMMLANAILSGTDVDSNQYKDLQKQDLLNRNKVIYDGIEKLRQDYMTAGVEGTDKQEEYLFKITQLEAQALNNLVGIHKLTEQNSKQASFGLPSGINPMTHFEYYASQNTSRSIAAGAGNVNIQVQFGDVHGLTKEEADENIIKPLTEELTRVLYRSGTNKLSNEVKSVPTIRREGL